MRKLIVILGTPVDNLNMVETLDRLEEFVSSGRASGNTSQVVTINADFVVKARSDPELRYLLQEADLATADGMPLVWGARLLGVSLAGRVAGADLVPAVAERAAKEGFSIYLLGAAPGIAAGAAQILQKRYPNLKIAGVHSPPYTSVLEMDPSILEEIRASRPDILFVAFGNPKQEKWMGMYARQLRVPLMMGVGGSLDFITGNTKRAPEWMQRVGLEWFYRLLQEPRRLWRRYVVDLWVFGLLFIRQWWQMYWGLAHSSPGLSLDLNMEAETAVLSINGRMTVENFQRFSDICDQGLAKTTHFVINLAGAQHLDSSALGALVELARVVRDKGGSLKLRSVPNRIRKTLALLQLETMLRMEEDMDRGSADRVPARVTQVGSGSWMVIEAPRFFDANTAPQVIESCQELLAHHPRLILDLSKTDFITSAGLAALAQITRKARDAQGELRVTGCSRDVSQVIRMVNFDRVLALYEDLASATAPGLS